MRSKPRRLAYADVRQPNAPPRKELPAVVHHEKGRLVMVIQGKRYLGLRTSGSFTWVPEDGKE